MLLVTKPAGLLRAAWRTNKPLTVGGVIMLVVLAGTLVGLLADPRVITGAPAWLKPAKFAVSISIYCFTLLWLLTFVEGRLRLVRLVGWVTAVALTIEMVLIAAAATSGTTSHFNVTDTVSTWVWRVMAAAIIATWVVCLVAAILLLRSRPANRAFAWSLRTGIIGAAIGMAVAFLMTVAPENGGIQGAHSVGVADGGPGLPIVNWSTVGGDLRAPHFIGLHALQILPLLGYLIVRFSPAWLRPTHQVRIVVTLGLAYIGLVGLMTWQALRGQSVIRPDSWTLLAGGCLFAMTAVVVGVVVLRARSMREG